MKKIILPVVLAAGLWTGARAQTPLPFHETFDDPSGRLTTVGRGENRLRDGVLVSRDAYAVFGDESWTDYEFTFRARTPTGSEQVQIWAGFRAHNRYDRYIVGLKGGNQDDIYLSRMGYMGTDEFLGLRDLGFHPEPGVWYDFRVQVCGSRIRIFLNGEADPRIDVTDANASLAPSGPVTLGGAWLYAEFDDLRVVPLDADALAGVPVKEVDRRPTEEQKEAKRRIERAAYTPVVVSAIEPRRTRVSLDGTWLFMPEYQLSDKQAAVSPETGDEQWHVMTVPDFWNPSRIWLHGETFGREQHAKGVSDTYFQQETARCENYTFDFRRTEAAWYRQWIELPAAVRGRHVELTFDAISKVCEIYMNGHLAGTNAGMYTGIAVDVTPYIRPGRNLVTVKVIRDYVKDISEANRVIDVSVTVPITNAMVKDMAHGFFNENPAGIWQPAALVITDPVKVADVCIRPSLSGAQFEVTVKNHGTRAREISLATTIADRADGAILHTGESVRRITVAPGGEAVLKYAVDGLAPKLWTPQHPNLYDFTFTVAERGRTLDALTETSGFRTFVSREGYFWLNGRRYTLRGANHTPFALAPNSRAHADRFYGLMKAANIEVTRTHTTPYNELWMTAADENGIGISFEGTWPWLMIQQTMPDRELIDLWAAEWLGLVKKYRNHPSLLFWTVNNEMKFYANDPDPERAKAKMAIISEVVGRMREIDPTRPISFDSNYSRREGERRFGADFFDEIDDGDIDDVHGYFNWYDHSLFKFFDGEFQRRHLYPGRPLISQEMSTGYANSETGHATRFYNLVHQNPQSLIGYNSYEYGDPQMFLDVQSFITGELAEALRRSGDRSAGILHFALLTWFRNVYDTERIEPYPSYYAMSRSLAPVLVSAELWGRNFYAGSKLPVRFCVVNDREDGSRLPVSTLAWRIVDPSGRTIGAGSEAVPEVEHCTRRWIAPDITIPSRVAAPFGEYTLRLELKAGGERLAENEYRIKIADREWTRRTPDPSKRIVLADFDGLASVLEAMEVNCVKVESIEALLRTKADLYIVSGWQPEAAGAEKLRRMIASGARVLLLNAPEAARTLYPEYITGSFVPTEGDIVNLEIPEDPIFDGLGTLDLRYFNNEKAEIPTVCHSALQVDRHENVVPLAMHLRIHGYINGEMRERSETVAQMKGFPIVRIADTGTLLVSTMAHEKALTDPIAARLLSNLIGSFE